MNAWGCKTDGRIGKGKIKIDRWDVVFAWVQSKVPLPRACERED